MTAGFEGNRKAITSGFDKMDEVKKWDLEQLPGYEAIEEEEEEPVFYWITKNDLKLLEGEDESKLTKDGDELIEIEENLLYEILSKDKLNQDINSKRTQLTLVRQYLKLLKENREKNRGVYHSEMKIWMKVYYIKDLSEFSKISNYHYQVS